MIRNDYPDLAFCTLPEEVEGEMYPIVYGFEFNDGMYTLGAYMLGQGMLQGLAPLYVCTSVEKGLAWLDEVNANMPTQADLDYLATL